MSEAPKATNRRGEGSTALVPYMRPAFILTKMPVRAAHVPPAPYGLPPALADKLRPFAPPAAPRAKHVATFKDHRDNVWVFLNNPPANMFTDDLPSPLPRRLAISSRSSIA